MNPLISDDENFVETTSGVYGFDNPDAPGFD